MSCDRFESLLNDYVDGELSAEEAGEVRAHLAECAACTAAEKGLRGLVERSAALRREELPPRDLWPEIRLRLEPPARRAWARYVSLAVAAGIALAAAGLLARSGMQPAEPLEPTAVVSVEPEFREAENEMERVRQELRSALDARRDALAPETAAVIDENLQVIDQAVAEMRAALAQDPANHRLARQLLAIQRDEADLLRRAADLAAPVNGS